MGVRHQLADGVLLALASVPVFTTMAFDLGLTNGWCFWLVTAFNILTFPDYAQRLAALRHDRLVRISIIVLLGSMFAWHYFQGPFLRIAQFRFYVMLAIFFVAASVWIERRGDEAMKRVFVAKVLAMALTMAILASVMLRSPSGFSMMQDMPIYWHVRHLNYDLALVAGVGVWLWARAERRSLGFAYAGLFVAMGFFTAWSGGRGEMLCLLIFWSLLTCIRGARSSSRLWFPLVALLAGAVLAPILRDDASFASQVGKLASSSAEQLTSGRLGLWIAAIKRVAVSPESLLFGYAPDAFFRLAIVSDWEPLQGFHASQPHNVLIQWLLDFGVLGLALLLAFYGKALRAAVRILRSAGELDLPAVIAALLLGVFVYAQFDGILYRLIPLSFVVFLCAYVGVAARQAQPGAHQDSRRDFISE